MIHLVDRRAPIFWEDRNDTVTTEGLGGLAHEHDGSGGRELSDLLQARSTGSHFFDCGDTERVPGLLDFVLMSDRNAAYDVGDRVGVLPVYLIGPMKSIDGSRN